MPRIVLISDTHGLHLGLPVPDGDFLVHAGDFCNRGHYPECVKFFNWFDTHPHKHKIAIAGNHDIWLEKATLSDLIFIPPSIHYLHDSGVELEGIKFWGSPYQPTFFDWAFNVPRGDAIQKHWDKIPKDTNVLLTHGPAAGYLDRCPDYNNQAKTVGVGCANLTETIKQLKPKIHVCGHIHAGYGHVITPDTLYVNASVVNESYHIVNKPIVVDYVNGTVNVVPYW